MAQKARSFATMLGFKGARAEADDDEKEKDEKDAARADDGDEDMKRAESDDDEKKDDKDSKRAEDEGDDDADGDDDEKKRDDAKKATRAARLSERERCCQIFAHGLKAGVPELAGALALESGMSASAAMAVIDTQKGMGARRGKLAEAMAGVDIPNVGADAAPAGAAGEAQQLVAKATSLYDQATGGKR